MGIADPFCIGFVAVGKAVQKGKNIIRCNLLNLGVTEILAEPVNDRPIGPHGISFSSGPYGDRSRFLRLWSLSWFTLFGYWCLTFGKIPR